MDEIEVFTRGLSSEEINNRVKVFDLCGELIRDDTILVSICAVNSETGFRQPLKTILLK